MQASQELKAASERISRGAIAVVEETRPHLVAVASKATEFLSDMGQAASERLEGQVAPAIQDAKARGGASVTYAIESAPHYGKSTAKWLGRALQQQTDAATETAGQLAEQSRQVASQMTLLTSAVKNGATGLAAQTKDTAVDSASKMVSATGAVASNAADGIAKINEAARERGAKFAGTVAGAAGDVVSQVGESRAAIAASTGAAAAAAGTAVLHAGQFSGQAARSLFWCSLAVAFVFYLYAPKKADRDRLLAQFRDYQNRLLNLISGFRPQATA